jgi:hypothetical protein
MSYKRFKSNQPRLRVIALHGYDAVIPKPNIGGKKRQNAFDIASYLVPLVDERTLGVNAGRYFGKMARGPSMKSVRQRTDKAQCNRRAYLTRHVTV